MIFAYFGKFVCFTFQVEKYVRDDQYDSADILVDPLPSIESLSEKFEGPVMIYLIFKPATFRAAVAANEITGLMAGNINVQTGIEKVKWQRKVSKNMSFEAWFGIYMLIFIWFSKKNKFESKIESYEWLLFLKHVVIDVL